MYSSTEAERNELAKQYMPLVKKISHQMLNQCSLDYEEIEGFARVGLVLAMNSYDETKSSMSFTSWAAYGIRNAILNGINDTGRTIAVSYYRQKKMRERGEEIPSSISLNKNFDNEDHLEQLGFEEEVLLENPWDILVKKLKMNFDEEWIDMFCSLYGLNGHPIEKGKDIAKRLGISGCLVTKRTKKMVQFIQEDAELSEILRDLL